MLKQLATRLGADPKPTNPASLLRMEGTHNTKHGEPVLVEQLWGSGQPVDLSEIEALIDLLPETGLFTPTSTNGRQGEAGANFQAATRPPIDLENMEYGVNINETLWRFVGSEMCKGTPADTVIVTALTALEQSPKCQADPAKASWPETLADMVKRTIENNPTLLICLDTDTQVSWHRVLNEGGKPTLVWRSDLSRLHVRRNRKQAAPAINEPPKPKRSRHDRNRHGGASFRCCASTR